MKPLPKFKLNKVKQKVLFVDDDPAVHKQTSALAKSLGIQKRTAYSSQEATKKIELRIRAIKRLITALEKRKASIKSQPKLELIEERISALKHLQRNPFALVVSDINMPRGNPSGVKFARDLKSKLPKQKVLIHSDDYRRLEDLEREGFSVSDKNSIPEGNQLKEGIVNQLLFGKTFRKK